MIIIDGKKIAQNIRLEIAQDIDRIKSSYSINPKLIAVLIGDDPASEIYVRNKKRSALEVGIDADVINLPEATSEEKLLNLLEQLNNDKSVHGILVQLPLPNHINEDTIIQSISPYKDVDGLHPINLGKLMIGNPYVIPATPSGVQQLLIRSNIEIEGKHIVICGRSNIVGKPLANLFIQRSKLANATVSICHSKTLNLNKHIMQADILIAAIGQPNFIKGDMVKNDVVVIDVGTNRIKSTLTKSGYKLVGDVEFDTVSLKANAITPVPGGVGPMTIAMLLKNTVLTCESIIKSN
ncbi:MAG: bifunctional 5,10-methylene-tetrahydrofolate dehydrogenase/5,10-methylene-tetrahydrofolate cyclohydrolase [Chloroflexi bacterium]|nr:bifunctional 5,10-methylene-tetrahydrofolate dehydrogenase/5,10-methylene-tetrahydrofolate cyclohydrolase [Chloroflexota bacterium]